MQRDPISLGCHLDWRYKKLHQLIVCMRLLHNELRLLLNISRSRVRKISTAESQILMFSSRQPVAIYPEARIAIDLTKSGWISLESNLPVARSHLIADLSPETVSTLEYQTIGPHHQRTPSYDIRKYHGQRIEQSLLHWLDSTSLRYYLTSKRIAGLLLVI